jgi:hypothetical protein
MTIFSSEVTLLLDNSKVDTTAYAPVTQDPEMGQELHEPKFRT